MSDNSTYRLFEKKTQKGGYHLEKDKSNNILYVSGAGVLIVGKYPDSSGNPVDCVVVFKNTKSGIYEAPGGKAYGNNKELDPDEKTAAHSAAKELKEETANLIHIKDDQAQKILKKIYTKKDKAIPVEQFISKMSSETTSNTNYETELKNKIKEITDKDDPKISKSYNLYIIKIEGIEKNKFLQNIKNIQTVYINNTTKNKKLEPYLEMNDITFVPIKNLLNITSKKKDNYKVKDISGKEITLSNRDFSFFALFPSKKDNNNPLKIIKKTLDKKGWKLSTIRSEQKRKLEKIKVTTTSYLITKNNREEDLPYGASAQTAQKPATQPTTQQAQAPSGVSGWNDCAYTYYKNYEINKCWKDPVLLAIFKPGWAILDWNTTNKTYNDGKDNLRQVIHKTIGLQFLLNDPTCPVVSNKIRTEFLNTLAGISVQNESQANLTKYYNQELFLNNLFELYKSSQLLKTVKVNSQQDIIKLESQRLGTRVTVLALSFPRIDPADPTSIIKSTNIKTLPQIDIGQATFVLAAIISVKIVNGSPQFNVKSINPCDGDNPNRYYRWGRMTTIDAPPAGTVSNGALSEDPNATLWIYVKKDSFTRNYLNLGASKIATQTSTQTQQQIQGVTPAKAKIPAPSPAQSPAPSPAQILVTPLKPKDIVPFTPQRKAQLTTQLARYPPADTGLGKTGDVKTQNCGMDCEIMSYMIPSGATKRVVVEDDQTSIIFRDSSMKKDTAKVWRTSNPGLQGLRAGTLWILKNKQQQAVSLGTFLKISNGNEWIQLRAPDRADPKAYEKVWIEGVGSFVIKGLVI